MHTHHEVGIVHGAHLASSIALRLQFYCVSPCISLYSYFILSYCISLYFIAYHIVFCCISHCISLYSYSILSYCISLYLLHITLYFIVYHTVFLTLIFKDSIWIRKQRWYGACRALHWGCHITRPAPINGHLAHLATPTAYIQLSIAATKFQVSIATTKFQLQKVQQPSLKCNCTSPILLQPATCKCCDN